MQMNLQQGLTTSVIHAPIVSIGACPGMMSIQLEENAGRPLAAKIINPDGTTELKKNPRLALIVTKSLNLYKRAASAIGISIFKKCTDSLIAKGKFVARVGGKVINVGVILMLVGSIAAGEDPVDEGLRLLVGIDAETARRVLDGELAPSFPNPVDWIVHQSVDICNFADGSMLRVGQNIVCYGERENGERYWYDTKINKIVTTDRALEANGIPVATVIVKYRHDNRDDTTTWETKPITKVSDLPDRAQFLQE